MEKGKILFITANKDWGGSEVLWANTAKSLEEDDYEVIACAEYHYQKLSRFVSRENNFFDLKKRFRHPNLFVKAFKKIVGGRYQLKDELNEWVRSFKPALVVISQGNNIVGYPYMQLCKECNIPYVTVTQLVSGREWPGVNEELIQLLQTLYSSSSKNYFVSRQNLLLHEKMLGYQFTNSALAYNSFTTHGDKYIPFANSKNEVYKVALIGRIEFFHKGYDLLLDVIKQDKWRERNIRFSIFGNGPHLALLNRLIGQYELDNISVNGHVEDVSLVWHEHHILLMPSRMEGQSLALMEAMYYNRAVIATDVGDVETLIEEGVSGFIADSASVKSIDEALERAWSKRTEWEQMGIAAGKQLAEKQPADAVKYFIKQLEELLLLL